MPVTEESLVLLKRWRESLDDLLDILGGAPNTRSLDQLRASYIDMLQGHPVPDGIEVTQVSMGSVPARRVVPAGSSPIKVLVYFHGGAYIFGDSAGYVALAGRLALATGAAVYIPDFRLAPEHVYPVPILDSLDAYRSLLEQGIDPHNIAFAGDSAGGALTVSVMTLARDAGLPLPAGGVAISPWVELEHQGASMRTRHGVDPLCTREALDIQARAFLGTALANSPDASPVFADVRGLPPILVQIGENEVMLSGAIQLATHLGQNRVRVTLEIRPGMFHVWHLFAAVQPEAAQAVQSAAVFLNQCWSDPQPSTP